jgi:hypothetical protein
VDDEMVYRLKRRLVVRHDHMIPRHVTLDERVDPELSDSEPHEGQPICPTPGRIRDHPTDQTQIAAVAAPTDDEPRERRQLEHPPPYKVVPDPSKT